MRVRTLVLMLSGVFWVGALGAQTAKDAEKAFRDSVLNQRLFLKTLDAESLVTYQWASSGIVAPQPTYRTLGVITPTAITTKSDRIEIKGTRSTLIADGKGGYSMASLSQITLVVMLNGSDSGQVFPHLKDALFLTTIREALAMIPKDYQSFLPGQSRLPKSSPEGSKNSTLVARCKGERVRGPRLVSAPDLEVTDEAKRAGVSGVVTFVVTIEASGKVRDLWLSKPLGFGLDEQGLKSVRNFVYKPATCDGIPIAVPMEIEMNFTFDRRLMP